MSKKKAAREEANRRKKAERDSKKEQGFVRRETWVHKSELREYDRFVEHRLKKPNKT